MREELTEVKRQYDQKLAKLGALCDAGKGETDEAEAIRDELDPLWRVLTKAGMPTNGREDQ